VLVPVLIDRQDTWSGIPGIRMTNQPHREWIWRMAYQVGRTIIGYEVQKVLAAVDWFRREGNQPVIVAGEGEGGLIAFYSAAVDARIDGAIVAGYFGPREHLWQEPIYRDVWGLLPEFGDAEIAALIGPRKLVVVASGYPEVGGPPAIACAPRGTGLPSGPAGRPGGQVGRLIPPRLERSHRPPARSEHAAQPAHTLDLRRAQIPGLRGRA
jgi:hypothetical protein